MRETAALPWIQWYLSSETPKMNNLKKQVMSDKVQGINPAYLEAPPPSFHKKNLERNGT